MGRIVRFVFVIATGIAFASCGFDFQIFANAQQNADYHQPTARLERKFARLHADLFKDQKVDGKLQMSTRIHDYPDETVPNPQHMGVPQQFGGMANNLVGSDGQHSMLPTNPYTDVQNTPKIQLVQQLPQQTIVHHIVTGVNGGGSLLHGNAAINQQVPQLLTDPTIQAPPFSMTGSGHLAGAISHQFLAPIHGGLATVPQQYQMISPTGGHVIQPNTVISHILPYTLPQQQISYSNSLHGMQNFPSVHGQYASYPLAQYQLIPQTGNIHYALPTAGYRQQFSTQAFPAGIMYNAQKNFNWGGILPPTYGQNYQFQTAIPQQVHTIQTEMHGLPTGHGTFPSAAGYGGAIGSGQINFQTVPQAGPTSNAGGPFNSAGIQGQHNGGAGWQANSQYGLHGDQRQQESNGMFTSFHGSNQHNAGAGFSPVGTQGILGTHGFGGNRQTGGWRIATVTHGGQGNGYSPGGNVQWHSGIAGQTHGFSSPGHNGGAQSWSYTGGDERNVQTPDGSNKWQTGMSGQSHDFGGAGQWQSSVSPHQGTQFSGMQGGMTGPKEGIQSWPYTINHGGQGNGIMQGGGSAGQTGTREQAHFFSGNGHWQGPAFAHHGIGGHTFKTWTETINTIKPIQVYNKIKKPSHSASTNIDVSHYYNGKMLSNDAAVSTIASPDGNSKVQQTDISDLQRQQPPQPSQLQQPQQPLQYPQTPQQQQQLQQHQQLQQQQQFQQQQQLQEQQKTQQQAPQTQGQPPSGVGNNFGGHWQGNNQGGQFMNPYPNPYGK